MSNVIQLDPPKKGETSFIQCNCTPEGTDFLVVVIVGESPIICGLVCPECEKNMPVVNGIVDKSV